MAKSPTGQLGKSFRGPARRGSGWRRYVPAMVAGGALMACALLGYLVLKELPVMAHLAMGLGFVVLAVFTFALASRGPSPEEVMARFRYGQHADHEQQLRAMQEATHGRMIKVPGVGEVSLRLCGGTAVALVAAVFWYTPWSPVMIKPPAAADLTVILGDDLAAGILVLPDARTAIVQPPFVPERARRAANYIRDNAPPVQLALRALAQGNFDEAHLKLGDPPSGQAAESPQALLARAQLAMYEGKFSDAARWYETLRGSQKDKGEQPMLVCQQVMAWLHAGEFRRWDAQKLLSEAAKPLPKTDPAGAACMHVQCLLAVARGSDFKETVKQMAQGRETWRETLGNDHPLLAAGLNNQAVVYVLQSNFTGTEVLFERAREIWSRFYGLQDPHVGLVYANLAAMQYARGDYAEAEKRLDEAAPLLERLPGEHPLRAVPMNLRAAIRHCRGDYEGARSTAEDALRIARAGLGSDHACILPIYDNLTAIYLGQAQYAKAVRLSDRRATRAEEIWGPEHPFLIQGLNRRVAVLTLPRSARYAEAGDDCQRAQRICRATLGNDHPAMVTELHAQGRLEMRQPQKSDSRYEAKRCLIKAGETWKKCLKEHPALVKENLEQALILADLAEVIASNRLAGYQAALDMLEKCGGAEHPEIARLLCEMALVQMEQEKWNEAAASLDRALAIQKKRLAANHPDRADALEVYGRLLSKMNPPDPDKAAELQKQAKDIRASHEKDEQAEANRQS